MDFHDVVVTLSLANVLSGSVGGYLTYRFTTAGLGAAIWWSFIVLTLAAVPSVLFTFWLTGNWEQFIGSLIVLYLYLFGLIIGYHLSRGYDCNFRNARPRDHWPHPPQDEDEE